MGKGKEHLLPLIWNQFGANFDENWQKIHVHVSGTTRKTAEILLFLI